MIKIILTVWAILLLILVYGIANAKVLRDENDDIYDEESQKKN